MEKSRDCFDKQGEEIQSDLILESLVFLLTLSPIFHLNSCTKYKTPIDRLKTTFVNISCSKLKRTKTKPLPINRNTHFPQNVSKLPHYVYQILME